MFDVCLLTLISFLHSMFYVFSTSSYVSLFPHFYATLLVWFLNDLFGASPRRVWGPLFLSQPWFEAILPGPISTAEEFLHAQEPQLNFKTSPPCVAHNRFSSPQRQLLRIARVKFSIWRFFRSDCLTNCCLSVIFPKLRPPSPIQFISKPKVLLPVQYPIICSCFIIPRRLSP